MSHSSNSAKTYIQADISISSDVLKKYIDDRISLEIQSIKNDLTIQLDKFENDTMNQIKNTEKEVCSYMKNVEEAIMNNKKSLEDENELKRMMIADLNSENKSLIEKYELIREEFTLGLSHLPKICEKDEVRTLFGVENSPTFHVNMLYASPIYKNFMTDQFDYIVSKFDECTENDTCGFITLKGKIFLKYLCHHNLDGNHDYKLFMYDYEQFLSAKLLNSIEYQCFTTFNPTCDESVFYICPIIVKVCSWTDLQLSVY